MGARECNGSGNYRTDAFGQWWSEIDDVRRYTSLEHLWSPCQTVT